jgi:hypothetical protein
MSHHDSDSKRPSSSPAHTLHDDAPRNDRADDEVDDVLIVDWDGPDDPKNPKK